MDELLFSTDHFVTVCPAFSDDEIVERVLGMFAPHCCEDDVAVNANMPAPETLLAFVREVRALNALS